MNTATGPTQVFTAAELEQRGIFLDTAHEADLVVGSIQFAPLFADTHTMAAGTVQLDSSFIVDIGRLAQPHRALAERLARAAWSVLNHDNDIDGPEPHNVQARAALITALELALVRG